MPAATIIEVSRDGFDQARANWLLSQVRVEAVTKESARRDVGLLKDAGPHGHKYVVDAMVAEFALRIPGLVVVLELNRQHGPPAKLSRL